MEIVRYHRVAIVLHWGMAALIVANLALGIVMGSAWVEGFATDIRFGMYQWHKTFGILVLLLSIIRVWWRLTHRPPAYPDTMSPAAIKAAKTGHTGLYFLMLAVPVSGWLLVSASSLNIPTLLFNAIPWPHLPVKSFLADAPAFANIMSEWHGLFAYAMLALLIAHIAAAYWHSLRLKDGIMQRMLFAKREK